MPSRSQRLPRRVRNTPRSSLRERTACKFLQTASCGIEGCMNRHGRVFSLRLYFEVFRVLPAARWRDSKVDTDSGDAATPFVFWSLHLYPAAQQIVARL